MKSLIIGIARTGTAHNHVLNPDTKYIAMCGSAPEITFSINCGQDEFFKEIEGLRYDDPASSPRSISYFQELATRIFNDIKFLKIDKNDSEALHIRLITSPLELAQIPFEFVLSREDPLGQRFPLLAHPKRTIILTREVRQESEAMYIWPHRPRILFAWAQPTDTVPHEDHLQALKTLLIPVVRPKENIAYPEPDTDVFLTVLPHASIQSIAKEIRKGVTSRNPYTHVHILAHGGHAASFSGFEFRLILCEEGSTSKSVKHNGEDLIKAFVPDRDSVPTVISLCACDSGNTGNTIIPSGSLIQQLHNAGVPCVFASQFPLTKTGSVKLVTALYHELINACDPRTALYHTRMVLREDLTHDWASLIAYTRFPDDINEQLQDAQLKIRFATMKTTNIWVDHVFRYIHKIPVKERAQALEQLETRLNGSIDQLSLLLAEENKKTSVLLNPLLQAEHLGLLGSAYKRKAEYLFRLTELSPDKIDDLVSQSKDALAKARAFYKGGFDSNPNSHWNALQYLSLELVLEGTLESESDLWTVTKYMSEREEKIATRQVDRVWAWGTLAELYMLKPFTAQNILEDQLISGSKKAKEYLTMMAQSDAAYNRSKESTARQFERYTRWWPNSYPENFPKHLKDMAHAIRGVLPPSETLIS